MKKMLHTEVSEMKQRKEFTVFVKQMLSNHLAKEQMSPYSFSNFPNFRSPFFRGVTFGLSQFDLSSNWQGISCLKKCKFKPGEVVELFNPESTEIDRLNKKLACQSDVVDEFDEKNIRLSILRLSGILNRLNIELEDDVVFLALLDYHFKFFISSHGLLTEWMSTSRQPISLEDFSIFLKKETDWGTADPNEIDVVLSRIKQILDE